MFYYYRSPLLNVLLEHDWCNLLTPLMKTTDYDTKEKVIQAITVSVDACKEVFREKHVIEKLKNTLKQLNNDINNEDDVDFKSYLESLRTQLDVNILRKLS